jgi:hypothetical protein
MSITIPLAMISDFLLGHGEPTSAASVIGALLVLIGFCLVNISPELQNDLFHRIISISTKNSSKERTTSVSIDENESVRRFI